MIGVIETAIIDRLQAAAKAGVLGYSYKTVESMPVQLDEDLFKKIQGYPSAWVVFGGWTAKSQLSNGAKVRAAFHVIVAAQNHRNESSTRNGGSPAEPGSYQMAMDVAGLLGGQDCGLPIRSFDVGTLTPLYSQQADKPRGISVLALELWTEFVVGPIERADAPVDFTTFHVDWDIPPDSPIDADLAQDERQLPDDIHADAVDHVTLSEPTP